MEKIVVVMPAWNEEENISRMIEELVDKEFPKIPAEMHLLVVDNYSKDKTAQVVQDAAKTRKNVHIIEQGDKSGLGWAYVRGFRYAVDKLGADAVMEMDADFQHPPRFVRPMVEAYLNGADYVIGSRYIPGGSVPKEWDFSRKFVSFAGNLFIRLVLLKPSIHDLTTGFRLTRVKGVLDKISLEDLMELDRFAYKVDLLYQSIKNAKKVVEVPLEFAPRIAEKSKFNAKEMISTFKLAIIIGIKDKQRFIKFGIVGFIGFIVNYIGIEVFRRTTFVQELALASGGLKNIAGLNILTTPSSWSAALGAEMAIISNFSLNNIWTFKEKRLTKVSEIIPSFLKFNLTSVGAVIIQFIVIGFSVLVFGDTSLVRLASLVFAIIFLIIPYNYSMYNLFIWKTWKLPWKVGKH
jgi:dolichol-phosphate mannosyltransferase